MCDGFRIWLILKPVTPSYVFFTKFIWMELDWGGGCSFCFLFFLGREKSKNFVLLNLKEWCDKEWHGVCPSLPNPWLVWSPDKKLGTESEGVVFQAEFKRFWGLRHGKGSQPYASLQRWHPAPPSTGSWWAPTVVAMGFGTKKVFARTLDYSKRTGKTGDLTQQASAKGV